MRRAPQPPAALVFVALLAALRVLGRPGDLSQVTDTRVAQ